MKNLVRGTSVSYSLILFHFVSEGDLPLTSCTVSVPTDRSIITQSVQPNRGTGRPKIVASLLEQMNASDKALTDCGAGVPKSGVLYTAHDGSSQRQKSYKTLTQKCISFPGEMHDWFILKGSGRKMGNSSTRLGFSVINLQ